jgi:hypothetical protein
MGEAKRRRTNQLPDWVVGEPSTRFNSLAEAWADAVEYTREISPHMCEDELRALRAVFHAGARIALADLPHSRSAEHFGEMMEKRWEAFARNCVAPYMRPMVRPVFDLEALRQDKAAIVDHQRGYWQAGVQAVILCQCSGADPQSLLGEVRALGDEIQARAAKR